jgi:hypothetical protein
MGVVASWSLMRFLPGAVLFVHSDGTLHDEDIEAWRRVVEPLEFVPKDTADLAVTRTLRDAYPNLHEWRKKNWAAYQLTDYALFGSSNTVISCDTDVLFLSAPDYLIRHLDDPFMHWNQDVRSCYAADVAVLRSVTGLAIPERLNCGLAVMPRVTAADLSTCETAIQRLKSLPDFDLNHPYSSQTYVAFVAATQPGSGPLPADYAVYRGRTRPTSIARHYVGVPSIRSRYFLEGWPALFQQAGLA